MAYGISETPSGLTITLAAKTRDELYRDAVRAALEAAYGGKPPAGASDGQTYPVQGAGLKEGDILRTFLSPVFRGCERAAGTLRAPRWLALRRGARDGEPRLVDAEGARPRASITRSAGPSRRRGRFRTFGRRSRFL